MVKESSFKKTGNSELPNIAKPNIYPMDKVPIYLHLNRTRKNTKKTASGRWAPSQACEPITFISFLIKTLYTLTH